MSLPRVALASTLSALLITPHALASDKGPFGIRDKQPSFHDAISQVTQMPHDEGLRTRTERLGLNVVNVMWEDTGRDLGSSVGPNISDLTLQVRETVDGRVTTHLLPVIRHPNFSDKTADMPADKLWVRVGNAKKGGELVAVPLTEVLENLGEYLSDASSLKGRGNLLAKRDTHFLVSAQHVFLPVPRRGKAEFNPVLYNYQSSAGNPAVLTLLITREGMSATVIENRPGDQDLQGWGQQLYFNNGGQKTVFTAERKSDVARRIDTHGATQPNDSTALEEGADMMLVVQVPLVFRAPRYESYADGIGSGAAPTASMKSEARRSKGASDVEQAVLGHGKDLGRFVEANGLALERDARFPVRVTVQFYKATSNGVVSDGDLREVARTIDKVYESGDYVGSLVVPEGQRVRPTAWTNRTRSTRDRGRDGFAGSGPADRGRTFSAFRKHLPLVQ